MGDSVMRLWREALTKDEGNSYTPYRDSKGQWTIGVGYYIGKELTNLRLSFDVIQLMLTEKIEVHLEDLCQVFGEERFNNLADARQFALLTMMFGMGRQRFETFAHMIRAIIQQDWSKAALEAKDSNWAKDVDPHQRRGVGRDDRVAFMLETGQMHPYYLEK